MKYLIIILAIFLSMSLNYQFTYSQWVERYNGPGNYFDNATSIAVDNSGNVYVTGTSGSGTTSDYATIKYNSSGVRQWVQIYNGPGSPSVDIARSIAVDSSGNVYVTGKSGVYGTENNDDYATIKYNSSGVLEWVQIYDGPATGNDDDEVSSISVDNSGNVYVTGKSKGIGTSYDYATIKYSSSGVQQWVQRYDGTAHSADRANSIAVDKSGNVYVTGLGSRGSFPAPPRSEYATIKYSSSGVQQWVRTYIGPGNYYDEATSIAVDNSGNVYVTGSSYAIRTDYATIKYNSNGDSLWVQRYDGPGNGSEYAYSIAVDSSGNVYVTGYSEGIGTGADYATIKYNSTGVQQWFQRYNGPGNGTDRALSMAIDDLGNVYVTGESVLGIETGTDYATIKYNSSGVNEWVQRYNGFGAALVSYDYASSIAVDNSGNVYVTGRSEGIGTFGDYATIKYSQQPTTTLNLTALIQGFYDNITNTMVRDTVRVYLRNTISPYSIVDSATSVLDSTGYGTFYFPNAVNGTLYYIVVKHRNSIETWSNQGKMFTSYQLSYDFITAANKAYGDNLILKGIRYCIYSGDVNQDGSIDLSDIINVYNDVTNLVTGYVATDVNGNGVVDLNDLIIAFNNSNAFVSIRRP